ncbi:MAG: hypothetical protein IPM85_00240 [Chitinophagaceae bacterium]|nr:hypothetical protein [Chitinophagaceae bacterium]
MEIHTLFLCREKINGNRCCFMLMQSFSAQKEAGGFVGCMYAMYGTTTGKQSENAAMFNWF